MFSSQIDRVRGCLFGGAIGDAIGKPLEFFDRFKIREFYFDIPIEIISTQPLEITDDTQMTLFTIEGILNSVNDFDIHEVYLSYNRWLHTQRHEVLNMEAKKQLMNSFLISDKRLNRIEAPGLSCLKSLDVGYMLTKENHINNSRGCGGVMRVAPIGIFFNEIDSYKYACETAVLTHGHPTAQIAAGALATIISALFNGMKLEESVNSAVQIIRENDSDDGKEVLDAIQKAVDYANSDFNPESIINLLGQGWRGDEALAIGLFSALIYPDDFNKAIELASVHDGDSDSTASICGSILGVLGCQIDDHLIDQLEIKDILHRMAASISQRISVSSD